MTDKIRRTYGAFTASYDCRTVSKFVRYTNRAFTLEYCAKTAVYGSLRRSVMIDLGTLENENQIDYDINEHLDKLSLS